MINLSEQVVNSVSLAPQHPVLVPVDFSSCSREALKYACDFICDIGAPMLILHVVHETLDESGHYRKHYSAGNARPMADIAVDMLDEFICSVKKELPSADDVLEAASRVVIEGLPASRIHEVAERKNAAFIIMGTHGRKGLSRLALGSVAEKVLQRSTIPVTVIKDPKVNGKKSASHRKGGWMS